MCKDELGTEVSVAFDREGMCGNHEERQRRLEHDSTCRLVFLYSIYIDIMSESQCTLERLHANVSRYALSNM